MPKKQKVTLGSPVPDFMLQTADGETFKLSDYLGKAVVLYFYPQDMTPTCTQQACDFRDDHPEFEKLGAVVAGISPDPIRSHEKFAAKYELPFILLSDVNKEVCKLFDVWKLKKLYGREYMGIVRSTFLIDQEGRLAREWRNVRLKGHLEQVLDAVRTRRQ